MELSSLVTALVLGAALLHASWNAIIKSSRDVVLDTALVAAGASLLSLPLIVAVPMPASAGNAWLDCFRLVFRTNPDVTTQWYCPGVGLVRYQYHHNGSLHDEVGELLRYK